MKREVEEDVVPMEVENTDQDEKDKKLEVTIQKFGWSTVYDTRAKVKIEFPKDFLKGISSKGTQVDLTDIQINMLDAERLLAFMGIKNSFADN